MMIAILGGGLAGLSAAYHLNGNNYLILEKENQAGGLCRSTQIKGYTFDYAPHVFFTQNEYVLSLINKLLGNNLIQQDRRAYIYLNNVYVKYPFEANLSVLPGDVISECIDSMLNRDDKEPKNFKEWIYATFGRGIAEHYLIPYNEKMWKYDLSEISLDWISGRVPAPTVEEIKKGASGQQDKEFGPNAQFLYPKVGGMGAIVKAFSNKLRLSLNSKVTRIKHKKDEVEIGYEKDKKTKKMNVKHVVSTLPLPDIIKMFDDASEEVIKVSEALVHNSLVCINIGIKRAGISDKHWVYFPEKKIIFNRISFPMNFSRFTTPKGKSSILVEITYEKNSRIDLEGIKERVINGLIDADILKENDEIDVCDASYFRYAYVIHDLKHKKNVEIIHKFLKEKNIIPVGRFGEWEYLNMDKAILSGKNAVIKLKNVMK
ncbi:MAG: FAD-dependent oxidoreductase [Candidatus Aenigmarchaeota archaeon]|nr:FAD-dependent oxidoreductase [Candidatus Aenigmarchaeota archaeon]